MKWKVSLQAGRGRVEVDGKDISSEVLSVCVLANPGKPAQLVLKVMPSSGVDIEGEGDVVQLPMIPESDEAEELQETVPG